MAKYYDITPSEFVHEYLMIPWEFVRIGNIVYFINDICVLEYEYDSCSATESIPVDAGIFGTYNAATFSQDFGNLSIPGIMACLDEFQYYVSAYSDRDALERLVDDLDAYIPEQGVEHSIRDLFTPQFFEDWYHNLSLYDFFDSDKIKTICEIARDGAIFANEIVPYASEELAIALDTVEYWEDN